MVFEVIGTSASAVTAEPLPVEPPRLLDPDAGPAGRAAGDPPQVDGSYPSSTTRADDTDVTGDACRSTRRLPAGVIRQLLRSAVALQAESVLRTAGALSGAWGGVLDRTEWIERDARDLGALATAAVAAGVSLPAGVDAGAGEPGHPSSVVEGLLAGHEALTRVLRELTEADRDHAAWRQVVDSILTRREEEMVLLRAVGAAGELPGEENYMHGRPPRA
jgi:hypothetical protein